jgi:hypothetical protein
VEHQAIVPEFQSHGEHVDLARSEP